MQGPFSVVPNLAQSEHAKVGRKEGRRQHTKEGAELEGGSRLKLLSLIAFQWLYPYLTKVSISSGRAAEAIRLFPEGFIE